jgi:MFS family permease
MTHSTEWLATVALADAIANIVLMPIGGVIADRYDRLRVLLVSYGAATLQATLLTIATLSGHLSIGVLTALAAFHGACHAFSIPAAYGFLPRFIPRERLASAISVAAAYAQLGLFVGPAFAGWIIGQFGTGVAFLTNIVGYGLYFVCVLLMRTPDDFVQQSGPRKAFIADLFEGIRVIAHHPGIPALLTLMLFSDALAAAIRQIAPAYAATILKSDVIGVATLLACGGIGATLAALWLAHGGGRRSTMGVILWSLLAFLISVATLMIVNDLAAAGIAMVALGFSFEICRTGALAVLQLSVDDAVRGRVMSTQFLCLRLAGAIGVAVTGVGAERFGLTAPILVMTAMGFRVWLRTFAKRRHLTAAFSHSG